MSQSPTEHPREANTPAHQGTDPHLWMGSQMRNPTNAVPAANKPFATTVIASWGGIAASSASREPSKTRARSYMQRAICPFWVTR